MANFKVDFVFKDLNSKRSVGWTETLMCINMETPEAAMDKATGLALKRIYMLGANMALNEVRVSDITILGDSLVQKGPPLRPGGIYNSQLANPTEGTVEGNEGDFSYSALECRVEGTSKYRRPYWLSGNPDWLQTDALGLVMNQKWLQAFEAWVTAVVTTTLQPSPWAFQVRAKAGDGVTEVKISGFNIETNVFTTDGAHGLQPTDQVSFRGKGLQPKILGLRSVATAPTATTFTILGSTFPTSFNGPAWMRKFTQKNQVITSIAQNYFGQKKRGGISFAARGRRRSKKSAT